MLSSKEKRIKVNKKNVALQGNCHLGHALGINHGAVSAILNAFYIVVFTFLGNKVITEYMHFASVVSLIRFIQ